MLLITNFEMDILSQDNIIWLIINEATRQKHLSKSDTHASIPPQAVTIIYNMHTQQLSATHGWYYDKSIISNSDLLQRRESATKVVLSAKCIAMGANSHRSATSWRPHRLCAELFLQYAGKMTEIRRRVLLPPLLFLIIIILPVARVGF